MKQIIISVGLLLTTASILSQGGVGISNNSVAPNPSAMLDVDSDTKGILIPRVSLTSTTDLTTITNGNIVSLLVYNTSTIADITPGYYFWDGTVWKTMGGGDDADADPNNEIQDLQLVGNNLSITNNGTPTIIDLSPYLDNSDTQNIDSVSLNGSNLTVYIENGASSNVDLSSLSDHDWYEVGGTDAPDNITDDIFTQGNVGIDVITPLFNLDVDSTINTGGHYNQEAVVILTTRPNSTVQNTKNTAVGVASLNSITTGNNNVGLGWRTLQDLQTGNNNVAVGALSLQNLTTAIGNTALGYTTLGSNISGNNNSAFGTNALSSNTLGDGNIGIGQISLRNNIDGNRNTAVGVQALFNNTGGNENTALGWRALQASTTGIKNLAVGANSLFNNTTGSNNVAIGEYAGKNLTTGNKNIIIGNGIDLPNPTANNQLNIGNIIYGVNVDGVVNNLSSGNIGIGTQIPTSKLDINGDLRIQTITPGAGSDAALVADANGVVKQVAPNPVGEIIIFPVNTPPTGYLICDGSAVSRTTYSDLFGVLGVSYGAGDGASTFNLPDLRGEFVRGSDNGRGLDPARVIGSVQSGTLITADTDGISTTNGTVLYTINPSSGMDLLGADIINPINTTTYNTNAVGFLNLGSQSGISYASRPDVFGISRPRNIALNYCIRF